MAEKLELNTFLDLDRAVVERVLARERDVRRSGPIAENVLKAVGLAATRVS
jgi:pyruvate ferredoxin oxidoreductase alpha subunit